MDIHRLCCRLMIGFASALLVLDRAHSADAEEGIAFFESKIRPPLIKHCYECHSTESGTTNGGLAVDSRQSIRRGGERGAAVVPGDVEGSMLLKAIGHTDPDLEMPPTGKRLPDQVIADFRHWIEIGAPDPRSAERIPAKSIDIQAAREFWSLRPPQRRELPPIDDPSWPRRDLDYYISFQLVENQLSPSADAESETLLRRLHFDLIGLPPSPVSLANFVQRTATLGLESALEAEVESLLASPQFGERWGRHWLDVARFAESSGKETNVTFPHAWRYRNYVIGAINEDKPYDVFLTEQIAGDLLDHETDEKRAENLIATGFLAVGPKSLNETNRLQFLSDVADEQIDTVTRATMASSVACARCHDHKFDPFTMRDYYGLVGIFMSTKTHFGTSIAPGNQVGGDLLRLPAIEGQPIPNRSWRMQPVSKLRAELAALQEEKKERMAAAQRAREEGGDPSAFFTLQDALRILWRTGAVEGRLKTMDESGNPLPLAMGVLDRNTVSDAALLERGEIARPGETVSRGFPDVVDLPDFKIAEGQSGRLELALWLTDPHHPLTARVMANRVWHHLFGAGLVRTVDNFGQNGERPSHPELLDYLAISFVDNGWSLKKLIREIVTSRTYRQASTYRADAFAKDPENRFLWRANKRRLDAEAIRDAMLAVCSNLELQPPRGSLIARIGDKPVAIVGFDKRMPSDMDGSHHRSVYLPVIRDRLPDVLDLFDFAEPSLVTGARETTNVPLQALYLMNSPFVHEQSRALGVRLQSGEDERSARIQLGFQLCYGRHPTDRELQLADEYLQDQLDRGSSEPEALATFCQALLSTAEFRNLD